jgi:hypothetical protein
MLALTLAWAAVVAWGLCANSSRAYFDKQHKD